MNKALSVILKIIKISVIVFVALIIVLIGRCSFVAKVQSEYRTDLRFEHYKDGLSLISEIDRQILTLNEFEKETFDSTVLSCLSADSFPKWDFSVNDHNGSYRLHCYTASMWPISIGVHLTFFSDEDRWELLCDGSRWSINKEFGERLNGFADTTFSETNIDSAEIIQKVNELFTSEETLLASLYLDILIRRTDTRQEDVADLKKKILVELRNEKSTDFNSLSIE